ncbi:sigma-70 family RNA polymerase sigma factor [Anaerotruncus sp. 80]|uniref:Sigma-70 family RNA polymerase sigma factor n=1 Tax=Anaerotruncus colihominis TaxID=169435 RepID=A0A845QLX7_9FIRM|nr:MULTISPECIES: sigma-70 family RNA polymerase sigma factor [Anaerotruncus]NBH62434.1 sigma-70 family RNA polymerase sigma factor [Anaerotruncus colihominis]NCF03089.1 sigma-70 family RNA polymerase sigma factor [Anaerotruncus sp. 80]
MTNEELALKVKSGDTAYLLPLWEGVQRLVEIKARSYNQPDYYDDMIQEAYLQLQPAAERYKPSAGKSFIGYYIKYYVPNAFKIALYGGRSESRVNSPDNHLISLYRPVGDDTEACLIDELIDLEGETAHRHIEDADFWQDVGRLLRKGIKQIPSDQQREAVNFHYLHDTTFTNAAHLHGIHVNQWRSQYQNGLRKLRKFLLGLPKEEQEKSGLNDYLESHRNYAGGMGAWKNSGFTSNTEAIALKRIQLEEEIRQFEDIVTMLKM